MTLWITIPLLLLASASPTLTLLKLWQLKEWRPDRLREHMARESWLKQLFGWLRPSILGIWFVSGMIVVPLSGFSPYILQQWGVFLLLILAALTCAQYGSRKQPMPVWTGKAAALTALSLFFPALAGLLIDSFLQEPANVLVIALLPYFAPVFIVLAWLALKPADIVLKRRIIAQAIALRNSHPRLTVIGVTGSVGKTTTKELLAHVLKSLNAVATPVHLNTEIGVARWLISLLKDLSANQTKIIIVEMGAYRTGEIDLLTRITVPQLGIVTYIGNQHLSLFGSSEAIQTAKGELLRALPENGHAFLNSDNEAFSALRAMCRCRVTSVGTDGHADVTAFDVEETLSGLKFRALDTSFEVPIAGTHNVTSVLLAIAVARHLNIPVREIQTSLRTFAPLKHTFEVQSVRGVTVLDDTYNLSPMSFRAATDWARQQPHRHKILLTDGIIELGSKESEIHRSLAGSAATVFDTAYIVSPHFLPYFRDGGFGERAKSASVSLPIEPGDLLVCAGRLPRSLIERLLPPV